MDRVYTPAQVAEELNVSQQSIYNWIASGRLRAIRVGRHWRIRAADLEEFVKC